MIGSLMSRMGMAEKLSIPQLQKAIQDGTLPAYVGVPLLQQKVQEQKQAQAAMAGAAGQHPSIAQQVMGEAQGIEAAQSNLPAEGFADGGILNFQPINTDDSEHEYAGGGMVAFAEGDLVDDEEDDDSTVDFYDALGSRAQSEQEDLLQQYAAGMRGMPEGIGAIGISLDRPTGTGIRPEAKAPSGIEALEARVLRQESGGRRYDKDGKLLTSSKGAEGEMQVMPMTQRDPGFGVTPAKDDSPEEKARVGRDYLRALYKRYGGDEQLTLMAYNWGPGNVDKYLKSGRDIAMVPQETRKYASLAEGGIASIKRYAGKDESLVQSNPLDYMQQIDVLGEQLDAARKAANITPPGVYERSQNPDAMKNYQELITKRDTLQKEYEDLMATAGLNKPAIGVLNKNLRMVPKADPLVQKMIGAKNAPDTTADYEAFDKATAAFEKERDDQRAADEAAAQKEIDARAELEKQQEEAKKNEPPSAATQMQTYLDKLTKDLQKQRDIDNYMALLAGGLGMMGGSSPFAAANIGQGGLKGVEALMASNKTNAAMQNAITKGQLGAYQLQQNQDVRKALAADQAKKDAYGKMGTIRTNIEKNIKAEMGLDPIASIDDKNIFNKVQTELERRLAAMPEYKGLHKIATGLDYDYGITGKSVAAPVNYQNLYGTVPRKS